MRTKRIPAIALVFLAACAAENNLSEKSAVYWRGRHIDEVVALQGPPTRIMPAALAVQRLELTDKYGYDYFGGTVYETYKGIPYYGSIDEGAYTIYRYDHPKLRNMSGHFRGSMDIAVNRQGIIQSGGSGGLPGCRLTWHSFNDWMDGYATKECVE